MAVIVICLLKKCDIWFGVHTCWLLDWHWFQSQGWKTMFCPLLVDHSHVKGELNPLYFPFWFQVSGPQWVRKCAMFVRAMSLTDMSGKCPLALLCVSVCVCTRTCVCACVHACMCICVCVFIHDNVYVLGHCVWSPCYVLRCVQIRLAHDKCQAAH